MPTPQRCCSTCRYFQPAPLWRKGWCRNPLLYAPHQHHLVDERDLDCNRQFGDYWEPIELTPPAAATPPREPAATTTADPTAVVRPTRPATRSEGARPAAPPPRRDLPPMVPLRTREDVIRLAAPAAVIAALLIGYITWTGFLFRSAATPPGPAPTAEASPAATAPITAPTIAPASPSATTTPRPATPTGAAASPTAPPATPTAPPTPGGLRVGGSAVIDTGAGGENLRLRRDPGSTGVVLRSIKNGERVTVLDGPRQADGQAWWRVQYDGEAGWVAGAFIKPAA